MKRLLIVAVFVLLTTPALAQQEGPDLPYESGPFLKITADRNLGEVLAVAVNSKGHVVVLTPPGTSATGAPVYGNATTNIFEYDEKGNFMREIAHGVYGLAYAHSGGFDRNDNLWIVDKAVSSVIKLNPEGIVLMNLGRRDEGPDEPRDRHANPPPTPVDAMFNGSTDVPWDG